MESKIHGTAYSYIRFSSKIQERGDSLRRQRELRDDWLTKNPDVHLDESLTLEDLGVSAFRGGHRNDKYALGQFLRLIETGRIARGSILVVENLDRLSREEVGEAVELFLSIVNRGITIVQLMPSEQIFAKPVNLTSIIMAVVELARGGSESASKSVRVSSAWADKKRLAAEGKGIVTARAPAWLAVVNGAFEFKQGARETLRRIMLLCVGGMGCRMITATFNREKVPTWGKIPRWEEAYVRKIVHSRATIGTYQPKTAGIPEGLPIPNYFPAAVTEKEYLAAQGALAGRNNRGGRPPTSPEYINPFGGLLWDAMTGEAVHILGRKDDRGTYRVLAPCGYKRWGGKCLSFPLPVFEEAVLSMLKEIDPREIIAGESSGSDVLEHAGRLAEIEGRIEGVKSQLVKGDDDVGPLMDVLRRLETDRKKVADELAKAKVKDASPLSEAWGECRGLIDALNSAPDPQEARVRLRAAVRRIVSDVRCLFVPQGENRVAAVQVWFTGSTRHRDYLIINRPARHLGKKKKRPVEWSVSSFASANLPALDLRNAKEAAKLEKALLRALPAVGVKV